jgi:hypothetical protein
LSVVELSQLLVFDILRESVAVEPPLAATCAPDALLDVFVVDRSALSLKVVERFELSVLVVDMSRASVAVELAFATTCAPDAAVVLGIELSLYELFAASPSAAEPLFVMVSAGAAWAKTGVAAISEAAEAEARSKSLGLIEVILLLRRYLTDRFGLSFVLAKRRAVPHSGASCS